MRTLHRTALLCLTVAMAGALAACGGGSTTDDGSLRMYSWSTGDQQWQSFIANATKEDPSVKITLDSTPSFNDYWTKVKTQVVGGTPPCIVTTQPGWATQLKDVLHPLDDLVEKNKIDTGEFNDGMIRGLTVDGELTGLPYDAEPIVLYYNRDLFKAKGLPEPGVGYTVDSFVSDATALTGGGKYGFAVEASLGNSYAWIAGHGASYTNADGEMDLNSQPLVDAYQSYFDLVAKDKVAEIPDANLSPVQKFTAGDAAMIIEGPWTYTSLKEDADFDIGVASVPTPQGAGPAIVLGSAFGITKACEDKDAAFKAIVALSSSFTQEQMATDHPIVPSREALLPKWSEGRPADFVAAVQHGHEDSANLPQVEGWTQTQTLFGQYAIEGFTGQTSAAEILKIIQDTVKK